MTEEEKLDLIPDEIRNKSYMDFTPKELIFVITLNLFPRVYDGIYVSYNEDLYLKKEFIKQKYCYYEKET